MVVERGSEHSPAQSENAPIAIRLGEPFKLPALDLKFAKPGFISPIVGAGAETVDLDIESIGEGEVRISPLVGSHYPLEPGTIPFTIKVTVDDLPREKIERVTCSMRYKGRLLEGKGRYIDSFLREDGSSDLTFSEWKPDGEKWEDQIAIPSREGVFDDIELIIGQAAEVIPGRMEPEPPNVDDFDGDIQAYEHAVMNHQFGRLRDSGEKLRERLDADLSERSDPTPRGLSRVRNAIDRHSRFNKRMKPMFDEIISAREAHQAEKQQKLDSFGPELAETIKELARKGASRDHEVERNENMLIEAFDRYLNPPTAEDQK